MFSVITNIYNKKTKGPTLVKFFTATGKLKKFLFLTTRNFFSFPVAVKTSTKVGPLVFLL